MPGRCVPISKISIGNRFSITDEDGVNHIMRLVWFGTVGTNEDPRIDGTPRKICKPCDMWLTDRFVFANDQHAIVTLVERKLQDGGRFAYTFLKANKQNPVPIAVYTA
jgi:hypothetical protein